MTIANVNAVAGISVKDACPYQSIGPDNKVATKSTATARDRWRSRPKAHTVEASRSSMLKMTRPLSVATSESPNATRNAAGI